MNAGESAMRIASTAEVMRPKAMIFLRGRRLAKLAMSSIAQAIPPVPKETARLASAGSRPKVSVNTGMIG